VSHRETEIALKCGYDNIVLALEIK